MPLTPQPLARRAHAPILILITELPMLQPLSADLYLASLPSLTTGFNVSASTVPWTLSLFVIGFSEVQGVIGPLHLNVAFAVGNVVGITFDGSLYPLAIVSCLLCVLVFGAVRPMPALVSKLA